MTDPYKPWKGKHFNDTCNIIIKRLHDKDLLPFQFVIVDEKYKLLMQIIDDLKKDWEESYNEYCDICKNELIACVCMENARNHEMDSKFIVVRKPILQEDEGRYRNIGFCDSKDECEIFIKSYLQGYWTEEDFIIVHPLDQSNKCG